MGENPPQMWCQKCCETGSRVGVKEKHRRERTEFFLNAILPVPKLWSGLFIFSHPNGSAGCISGVVVP